MVQLARAWMRKPKWRILEQKRQRRRRASKSLWGRWWRTDVFWRIVSRKTSPQPPPPPSPPPLGRRPQRQRQQLQMRIRRIKSSLGAARGNGLLLRLGRHRVRKRSIRPPSGPRRRRCQRRGWTHSRRGIKRILKDSSRSLVLPVSHQV